MMGAHFLANFIAFIISFLIESRMIVIIQRSDNDTKEIHFDEYFSKIG